VKVNNAKVEQKIIEENWKEGHLDVSSLIRKGSNNIVV
jgi:hypothetical protein